jgi:hypothetical protein
MKTFIKVIAAVFAAAVFGIIMTKTTIHAQSVVSQQAPLSVIVNPSPKQYRVLDIGRFAVANGQTAAGTLEAILNEMGTQGWKVVATSGTFVIMIL